VFGGTTKVSAQNAIPAQNRSFGYAGKPVALSISGMFRACD
jgi:hypothetical protein